MDTTETIGAWSNPPARGWSRVGAGTGRPLAESFRAAWRGRREVFATCTYESARDVELGSRVPWPLPAFVP